jgi:hypothetical protein
MCKTVLMRCKMVQNGLASRRVPRRPNKPKGKAPIRVNYYLPGDLVARVDRYAAKLAAGDPLGRPVTRTDALRILVTDALRRAGIE